MIKKSSLMILFLALSFSAFTQSYPEKDYEWFTNNHFDLHKEGDLTIVSMQKKAWEAFTLKFTEVDFSEESTLSFKIKSDKPIELRVDIIDSSNKNKTIDPIIKTIPRSDDYLELTYDFQSVLPLINENGISHFLFFANPGIEHTGSVWIKDIIISTPKEKEKLNARALTVIYPNPANKQIVIDAKKIKFNAVEIYDHNGRMLLQNNFSSTTKQVIDIEALPEGIFQVLILNENEKLESISIVK